MRLGEGLRQHGLARCTRRGHAPRPQCQVIQFGRMPVGYGHELPDDGLIETLDVEDRRLDHASAHGLHAGQQQHLLAQVFRRALRPREDVSEPIPVVIGLRRLLQRLDCRQRHDQHRRARCDHQGQRQCLGAHAPEIAEQLAVER